MNAMHLNSPDRSRLRVMSGLTMLFFLRVLGQLLVSRGRTRFLPPMEQWMSGLMPYPKLLTSQCAILTVQTATIVQGYRGHGLLAGRRPRLGQIIRWFSVVYFLGMIFRYCWSMLRHPERRWLGKTIPIWFHCVLATYLNSYAHLLSRSDPPAAEKS